MPPRKTNFGEQVKGVVLRHAGLLVFACLVLLAWVLDRWRFDGVLERKFSRVVIVGIGSLFSAQADFRVIILLPLATLFLAFSNLYLKISLRAPNIQRRLRPSSFASFPFSIYFGVYLLLAILAYTFLGGKVSDWFVRMLLAALIGIGAANADIKFGGMSLQPLAEFLQSLEAVVEAGLSTNLNELDIAKRASLHQLVAEVSKERLERECILLGLTPTDLQALQTRASNNDATYIGLLSIEVIKKSEANAWRLVAESSTSSSRYRIRWWNS